MIQNEIDIAKQYYISKQYSSKRLGIPFVLSFDELIDKIHEAGIFPSDIGCRRGQYVLGRKCQNTSKTDGDLPYYINTCRFITKHDNDIERVMPVTDEHKYNLSVALLNGNNFSRGNKGSDSLKFKGWYITPKGKFDDMKLAGIANGISPRTIHSWCGKENERVFKKSRKGSTTLDMLGKTPKDLGFGFLSK